MHLDSALWTITLCVGMLYWFYQSLNLEIDYSRHPQLIDPTSGKARKPSDLLDLSKIIKPTEKYINETNAQERLYDLEYMMNFENPMTIDMIYSDNKTKLLSGLPVANETKCGQDLNWILNKLEHNEDNYTLISGRLGLELTNLMDSFGKAESGLYNGVINWMGSHKSCMKVSLNKNQIKTRYCIGQASFKSWPKNETIIPKTSIRLGLCLPESCSTISFNNKQYARIIEKLSKIELPQQYKQNLQLDTLFCLPDDRSPIRQIPFGGKLFLGLVGGWLIVVLVASIIYEYLIRTNDNYRRRKSIIKYRCEINNLSKELECRYIEESPGSTKEGEIIVETSYIKDLLMSLSIRATIREFKTDNFKVKYKNGERARVHLGAMDFFKVTMAMVVVLGHGCFIASSYSRNLSNRVEGNISGPGKMVLSVGRAVDVFFFFFGVLTAYTLTRKFKLRQLAKPVTWFLVNFGIFLRIAPIFMLIYWYARTVSPYTGSGPYWDYGVYKWSLRYQCMSDSWWRSIPYLGSFGGNVSVPSCNLPSWFLISYSQISLILPLITYLLYSLPNYYLKAGLVLFLNLISALSISLKLYWQTSVKEEGFTLYGGFLADLMEKFEMLGHMATLGRVGAVTTGCFFGYLLFLYEEGRIVRWPRWIRSQLVLCIVLLAQLLIILAPLIGHYINIMTGQVAPMNQVILANFLTIIIFPVLNGITVLNATTINNHSLLVRFLSHSFWHIFNRLGLCIFLVHWEVLFVGLTSYETAPVHMFFMDTFKIWAFGLCGSIFFAILIFTFVESPLARLTTMLMKLALSKFVVVQFRESKTKQCDLNESE